MTAATILRRTALDGRALLDLSLPLAPMPLADAGRGDASAADAVATVRDFRSAGAERRPSTRSR